MLSRILPSAGLLKHASETSPLIRRQILRWRARIRGSISPAPGDCGEKALLAGCPPEEQRVSRAGFHMKLMHRSVALATVSLAALAALGSGALAGGFAVREQSAQAQGMSFAGAASGSGGLGSMFWNPATITMNPGWQSQYSLSIIVPEAEIKPQPGTSPILGFVPSGDIGQDAILVSGSSSIQINDWMWIGNTTSAPFGLVTKPHDLWAGQVYSRSSRIFLFDINPVMGIKVNQWLSIAAGPSIQYFDVKLKTALAPTGFAANGILEGDSVGIGWTAGLTLTPWAGTALGVGFRSSIHHELDGSLQRGAAP